MSRQSPSDNINRSSAPLDEAIASTSSSSQGVFPYSAQGQEIHTSRDAAQLRDAAHSLHGQQQSPPRQNSVWSEVVLGPSPALSARSYASSSADSDLDINELALDNWGRGSVAPADFRRLQAQQQKPSKKRRNSDEKHEKRAPGSSTPVSALVPQPEVAATSVLAPPSGLLAPPPGLVTRPPGPLAPPAPPSISAEEARRREEERIRRGAAAAHNGLVDTSNLRNSQVGGMLQMSKGISSRFLDRLNKSTGGSPSSLPPSKRPSAGADAKTAPGERMHSLLNARRPSDPGDEATVASAAAASMSAQGSLQTSQPSGLTTAQDTAHAEEEFVEAEEEEDDDDDVEDEPSGFDVEDEDEDDMHANGVPAARGWRLDAKKASTATFRATVLAMFCKELELETWSQETVNSSILPLTSDRIKLKRISGAFSNAVFFVSYDTEGLDQVGPRTVLLRVYGSGTEVLLSRRAELLILHTLSSLYEIGPHILGTFANGRVETYFDAEPIGKDGVRDLGDRKEIMQEDGSLLVRGKEGRAQWVARRMRQLHEVPLETMRRVLEQGDLRSFNESSSLFGRGVENHLFARSHKPRAQRNQSGPGLFLDPSKAVVESPAPVAADKAQDTSLLTIGVDGAATQRMGAHEPHRNNSVASFDSLATSFNSMDSVSVGSYSNDSLTSPKAGPSSYFDSYSFGSTRGNRQSSVTPQFGPTQGQRRASSTGRSQFKPAQPYPGMWRRSKRWAREAGKVFALVEDFCQTGAGRKAYEKALQGTPLEGMDFSPFTTEQLPRTKSSEIGHTNASLKNTLLAIAAIDFPRLLLEMDAFKRHVRKWEKRNGISRRVLAHGDTQYSNLLLIKDSSLEDENVGKGMPRQRSVERTKTDASSASINGSMDQSSRSRSKRLAPYERLIVIDFEYCSPNPRAYDIANAWHEWRFDYHHPTLSWSPYKEPYPTRDERRRWLRAYVEQGRLLRMRGRSGKSALDSPAPLATVPDQGPLEDLSLPPPVMDGSNGKANDDKVFKRPAPVPKQQAPVTKEATSAGSSSTSIPQLNSPAILQACGGVEASPMLTGRASLSQLEGSIAREIDRLEREVEVFSPACHASWALWGVTFAKEALEAVLLEAYDAIADAEDEPDMGLSKNVAQSLVMQADAGSEETFDNLRYALARVELFRAEIAALGITI